MNKNYLTLLDITSMCLILALNIKRDKRLPIAVGLFIAAAMKLILAMIIWAQERAES